MVHPTFYPCLILLLLSIVNLIVSYPHHEDFPILEDPPRTYTYTRFSEIKKHCSSIISSASDLESDDNRSEKMKKELFFVNGDWYQESRGSPLMPFNSQDPNDDGFPLKLVSFWIMDVSPHRQAKNTVSVRGLMEIGITRSGNLYKPYDYTPIFDMRQGTSKLTVLFEGVYVESNENGGQRLMCLLGSAALPNSNEHIHSGISENMYGHDFNHQPSTVQDDQIVLVLQYPKTFTLTTRGISGEMKSLNQRGSITYFDTISISSQLGQGSNYKFGSEEALKACNHYPHEDSSINEKIQMFKGDHYCEILRDFVWGEVFTLVLPGNSINSDYQNNLGPFRLDRDAEGMAGNFNNLRIMVQDLECESGKEKNMKNTARVSAVFRLIQIIPKNIYRDEKRTGLSGTTLSAEGIWHSSNGQLCMTGCLGLVGEVSDNCNTRICLYLQLTISIKQQNIIFGSMGSIIKEKSYHLFSFEKAITPDYLLGRYRWNGFLNWSYSYSKMMEAREFQERSKPSKFKTFLSKTFFNYPSPKGDHLANFSSFADVLSLQVSAAPRTSSDRKILRTNINMVVLSIGSFLGRYLPRLSQQNLEFQRPFLTVSDGIEISGHLSITSSEMENMTLFFEGVYDPRVGKVYLIGCRDARHLQEQLLNGSKLEAGLDCQVQIKIEFPPKNARWLLNPNIKFHINSQRSKKDHLYLRQVSFDTFLLSYKKRLDDDIFRKEFEEILRILMLTVAAFCLKKQLEFIENHGNSATYISLVMVGVQAIGYGIPLITGDDEVLFSWKSFNPHKTQTSESDKFRYFLVFDLCIKFLLLSSLLKTIKLLETIWERRRTHHNQSKGPNSRNPNEKLVFLTTLLIHIIGFFIFHVLQKVYASKWLIHSENHSYGGGNTKKFQEWRTEFVSYAGLFQDFFLLPQIIGNVLWKVQGKPLSKLYYVGFSMIRLLLQTYDYVRDPVPYPQSNEMEFLSLGVEKYAKLGNIVVGTIVVILALIVYLQQRYTWKTILPKKLRDSEDFRCKSDSYERLLSE